MSMEHVGRAAQANYRKSFHNRAWAHLRERGRERHWQEVEELGIIQAWALFWVHSLCKEIQVTGQREMGEQERGGGTEAWVEP